MPLGVPTGALRAPGSNGIAFATQSFIDELAAAAGKDPLQFRLDILSNTPDRAGRRGPPALPPGFEAARMRGVLELVREKSGWGKTTLPKGTGMGVAFHFSHRGYFAEVVQATVAQGRRGQGRQGLGRRRRRQPDHQSDQRREPGAGRGARRDRRGVRPGDHDRERAGGAENFNTFPLLRCVQAPPVEVHFKITDNPPTGLGEPALPPVVPALCSAIFCGDGQARSVVAVVEARFEVGLGRHSSVAGLAARLSRGGRPVVLSGSCTWVGEGIGDSAADALAAGVAGPSERVRYRSVRPGARCGAARRLLTPTPPPPLGLSANHQQLQQQARAPNARAAASLGARTRC